MEDFVGYLRAKSQGFVGLSNTLCLCNILEKLVHMTMAAHLTRIWIPAECRTARYSRKLPVFVQVVDLAIDDLLRPVCLKKMF